MSLSHPYSRILLKLSGEQFAGSRPNGIDPDFVRALANQIKEISTGAGIQLVIVVGGGNFMRGASIAGQGIERSTADYMGMLATLLNGMALVDLLEYLGQPARLQTRVRADSVAEPYIRRRAIRHLEKGRVVIVAGGTGNPYVTTDTAAVTTALELDCEILLKATKVDGIYDRDPAKFADAKKHKQLTHNQSLIDPEVRVMDKAAISLARENKLPILVFGLHEPDALKRIIRGESVGTLVK